MNYKKWIVGAGLALILIVAAVILYFKLGWYKEINLHHIRKYIRSFGSAAGFIFVLFFSLRTLFFIIPFTLMVILGGSLFGLVKGFLLSMAAVYICANIAFFIGRYAGRDFVQKLMKGKLKQLDEKVEEHGFKIIFLMRISFIFPFDIMNYAAGLSKVTYRDFILGIMLGIIPDVFALTYLGSNLGNPLSIKFIAAIVLVMVTIALPLLLSKKKKAPTKA